MTAKLFLDIGNILIQHESLVPTHVTGAASPVAGTITGAASPDGVVLMVLF